MGATDIARQSLADADYSSVIESDARRSRSFPRLRTGGVSHADESAE